ncbi:DUF1707 domain-containing protein [Nocardioidaceae bacterium SCSIO 66511]|nr:DUF1707 domain-containing protein [Nocardioidaceae bacterium SCSIO 66511]
MSEFTGGGGSTRARDADRDVAIALVDAAFGDGQLNRTEREERSEQIVAATTLGELRALTADLQTPVVVPPAPRRRRRFVPIAVAAAVAAAIAIGVVVGTGDDDQEPAAKAEPTVAAESANAAEPTSDPPEKKPKPATYSFTVRGVKNFIKLYRKEFGTTEATAFGFKAGKVNVARRGDTGEIEHWMYVDDGFVDDGLYSDRDFEPGKVDLDDLNVEAAFRHLGQVKRRVGIDKPEHLGITVVVASGRKGAWLVAGSDANCEADRMSLGGEVQERGTPCSS